MALRAVFAGIGQLLMAVDKVRAQMQEQATSSAPGQHRTSAAQPPPGQADGTSNVTVLRERATPTVTKPGTPPGGTGPGAATKSAAGPKAAAGAKSAAGPKAAAGAKTAAEPKAAAAPKAAAEPKAAGGSKSTAGRKAAAAPKAAAEAKAASGPKSTAGPKPAAGPRSAAGTKLSAEGKPAGTKPGADAKKPAQAKPATVTMEPAPAKPAAATPAAPIPGYDDLSVASLRARLRGLDAAGVQALLDYEKANARRDDVITMFERRLSKIENGAS
ncbi:MAG TPA: hypothetical protein VGF32_30005 [Streptosporangiaceae bacterium]